MVPEGYQLGKDGNSYKLHEDMGLMDFFQARNVCLTEGADVPSFHNEREFETLRGLAAGKCTQKK